MLLVRDIAAAAQATGRMSLDDVRTLTHVRGNRNGHLADPGGYDSRTGNFRQRHTPLPLNTQVHGEFLTLHYCGHGPWAVLEDHESVAGVERAILSDAGILNGWTDFVLAFVNSQPRAYEVRGEAGRLLARHGMLVIESREVRTADAAALRVVWTGG